METSLRISEIFYSLQGESNSIGWPTIFIRLTGCPLRCVWCDTDYAFNGGRRQSLDQIQQHIAQWKTPYVTVTGGEPLAQPGCLSLLTQLVEQDYQVSLETSGALDISNVDDRVVKVMDLKAPGSGEMERNCYENIDYLTPRDQLKFVIADERDYDWSKQQIDRFQLVSRCQLLFSPVMGKLSPSWLADRILEDQLPVRFQLQLHKILWGNAQGK